MNTSFDISYKNAHNLCTAVITARLFTAMTIDGAGQGNAAWISVLAAVFINIPLALITDSKLRKGKSNSGSSMLRIIAFAISVFETAAIAGIITDTIKCCGTFNARDIWIITVTILICLYALMKGGEAICNTSRMSIILLIPVVLVIVFVQMPHYRPAWLFPVFGNGMGMLTANTLRAAGYIAFAPLLYSFSEGEWTRKHSCTSAMLVSGILACVFCLLHSMMAPVITQEEVTRFMAIDMLVANGRVNLSLQLPLLIVLYSGFVISSAGYCLLAGIALKARNSRLPAATCAFIVAAAAWAASVSGFADRKVNSAAAFLEIILITAVIFISFTSEKIKRTAHKMAGA